MTLKTLALNAEGAFGNPDHWQDAVAFIEAQNPDIAFLGESHWEKPERSRFGGGIARNEHIVHEAVLALIALGYHVVRSSDDDASNRPDRTGFIGIVRRELGRGAIIRMGTRNGYIAEVTDPGTGQTARIAGQHYDDKDNVTRHGHINDLPDVDGLIGDLNNPHGEDDVPRMLRLWPFRFAASLIPTWEYDFTHARHTPWQWIKTRLHLGKRVVYMATGEIMTALAKHGLRDADPQHQPTMSKKPQLQLDHIMVGDRVTVRDFTVHHDPGYPTDHYPISAILAIEEAGQAPAKQHP